MSVWRPILIVSAVCWLGAQALSVLAQDDDVSVASEVASADFAELPPPAADTFTAELEQLWQRVGQLEAGDKKRAAADQNKKDADALKPTVKWSGQLQADHYAFNQDDASRATFGDIENGEAFRRARIAMLGDYGPTIYRIEADLALSGRPSMLDMWVGYRDIPVVGTVRVGHFFEPFSLERLTPNRYVTFMERPLPDQPFAPARNLGGMMQNTYAEGHGTWAVGYFRSNSDAFGDDVGDNFESAVTGRITRLLGFDDSCPAEYVHVGAAYSFRGTNAELAQFTSQPEARIGAASPNVPNFVNTGTIPSDHFQLLGVEAAWVHHRFSAQGEYMQVPVDRIDLPTVWLNGWYGTVSYFLTDDFRPYRKDIGTFDRVMPRREFVRYASEKCVEFGPGAWEVACRLSHLDFNDDTVQGGRLTDFSVGLNWYLNPYLRVTANYIHAFADHPTQGRSGTDIFAMRTGFEF